MNDGKKLTVREQNVLSWLAVGKTRKEIADALRISDETVKKHISSMLRKWGVDSTRQAIFKGFIPIAPRGE